MGDAEELTLLRDRYEKALTRYEALASMLNRHFVAGTKPSAEELQRESDARTQLERARREFLDAWLR